MLKIPLNVSVDLVARTIMSDYSHSSMYHIIMDRDSRFKMMGVLELYFV